MRPPSPDEPTRSTRYRHARADKTFMKAVSELQRLQNGLDDARALTLLTYRAVMQKLGADPDAAVHAAQAAAKQWRDRTRAIEAERKRAAKYERGIAAARANQAKGGAVFALVALRLAQGVRQVDIAEELGITDRRVRQIRDELKNRKSNNQCWSHGDLVRKNPHVPAMGQKEHP